jgi:integrase/recombinase XerD
MQSFQDFLTQSGKSGNTICARFACLSKFFEILVHDGIVDKNPCDPIRIEKSDSESIIALEVDEVKAIKNMAKGESTLDITNEMILILGFNLGLRRAEISKLKLGMIERGDGGYIFNVTGKRDKKRIVALDTTIGSYLMKLVSKYERTSGLKLNDNDFLVQSEGTHGVKIKNKKGIDTSNIYRRLEKIVEKTKIKKPITPHTMRATLATVMYDREIDITKIQRFLGHDNVATTMGYIKRNNDKKHAIEIALGVY